MARSALLDNLQVYRFWLLDISVLDSLSVPVLNPLMGFSSITAPEITSEVVEIQEGNWFFKRKVIGKAGVSSITLTRGATVWDKDFYNWIIHTISGESPGESGQGGLLANTVNAAFGAGVAGSAHSNPSPRRNLLLVQFFPRNPFFDDVASALALTGQTVGDISSGTTAGLGLRVAAQNLNNAQDRIQSLSNTISFGPPSLITLIPARAWVLYNCIPSRYRASQDFNARSSDVSLMELTVEPEDIEEILLG